jgi:hypothetical protein
MNSIASLTASAVLERSLAMVYSHGAIPASPSPGRVPGYLFANFNLLERYFEVKYTAGVHSFVSLGGEPVMVPDSIIDEPLRAGRRR